MGNWSTRTLNAFTDIIAVVVMLVLLGWALYWAAQKPVFWLRGIEVEIQGNKEALSAPVLAENLKDKVIGTYFTVDLNMMKDQLMTLPWVQKASVFRLWPNRLKIALTLHKPVALWGSDEVLAQDGAIFVANQAVAESDGPLPRIYGPKQKSADVYHAYLGFDKLCAKYGYEIASLTLSELSGWTLTFKKPGGKNIEVVFKAKDTPSNMEKKLEDILTGLPQIVSYFGQTPVRMDARYEKGVAVVRPEPEGEAGSEEGEEKDGR